MGADKGDGIQVSVSDGGGDGIQGSGGDGDKCSLAETWTKLNIVQNFNFSEYLTKYDLKKEQTLLKFSYNHRIVR